MPGKGIRPVSPPSQRIRFMNDQTSMKPIPVNSPLLNGNEKKYLMECLETGWISSEGPFVERFEREFSAYIGRSHGVAVANGSVALQLAVEALELTTGDEVILPTFTIISCAAAVVRAGATPVGVDCDPRTWNMDPGQVREKITSRTKAIMVVHIYGLPVDMDAILALADEFGLKIIEDTAEMHGQTYRGRKCGSFGDVSIFSFYPNKHITTGEGGMLVMDDPALADRCRGLRNLCFDPNGPRFVHKALGHNFRITNLQAALGVAQLERIDASVQQKRTMGARYQAALSDIPGIQLPLARTPFAENIYWVFGVVLEQGVPMDAAEAMRKLSKMGVGTRPFFWCMHEQPVFKASGHFRGECHPHAERIARRGFYLPSGLALAEHEIDRASGALRQVMSEAHL